MMPQASAANSDSPISSTPLEEQQPSYTRLLWACRGMALVLGAASAWVARYTMYPDGVSYLDVGDAFWHGDWHNAINAYWSPLYPLMLGLFMKIFRPSIAREYPLVHVVNFLLYVFALICFDVFLRTFLERPAHTQDVAAEPEIDLPTKWAWVLIGYSAFVVSSVLLITISFVSGDMVVAAMIYLASALILRIHRGKGTSGAFALLGLVLGVGYLAKAVMFVMSVPFFAVAIAAPTARARKLRNAGISLAFFLAIAAPFVVLLSVSKGRPTFGDSGKINYLMNVGTTQFFAPNEPDAKHPIRKLLGLPHAYEYTTPISGTYPPWFDPSYWHEGIRTHVGVQRQIRTSLLAVAECGLILFSPSMGFCITIPLIFLYLLSPNIRQCLARAGQNWVLWIPALAGIGLYSLVVIIPRYVAGLVCLIWMVGFSGIGLPRSKASRRLITATAIVVAVLTCLVAGWKIFEARDQAMFARSDVATPVCTEVAEALIVRGVHPGDKIAVISPWLFPSRQGAYIARLARVRIIAEARPDEYWSADESTRAEIDSQFAAVGAKAILTQTPARLNSGWVRLGNTEYYLHAL
jgi:hypothetical protein